MKTKERYFNFPIQLLAGFLKKPNEVLENIVDYALYVHTQKKEFRDENLTTSMEAAVSYYEISISNLTKSYRNGEMLFIKYGKGNPMTGLNRSILLSFHGNYKTEFEYVCLLAFLALKSILSTKLYCKTNNLYLWSRMDGKKKQVPMDGLSLEIKKYAKEYQTRKIKDSLKLDWYLKTYSNRTRGFYVSFDLSLKSLILVAEEQRQSYRLKKLSIEEHNIVSEVKTQLQTSIHNCKSV